jgi:hypothetical protein
MMIDYTFKVSASISITAHESTTLGFVDILKLVTLTPLETSNKLIFPNPGSPRAIEDCPV